MSKQKNYFGRVAALLLALGLCCAPAAAAESDTAIFSDVPADAWYADAAAYVSENGLMGGTGAATFSPNAVMTRGMLVTVLCRAAGSPALAEGDLEAPFQDVPLESWYAQSITSRALPPGGCSHPPGKRTPRWTRPRYGRSCLLC